MFTNHRVFIEKKLEILYLSGDWSIEDYTVFLQKITSEPEFEHIEKILADLRSLNTKTLDNFDALAKLFQELPYKEFHIVHLVDQPSATAKVHLYLEALTQRGYNHSYCSTINYALELLGLDFTEAEMKLVLNDLKPMVKH